MATVAGSGGYNHSGVFAMSWSLTLDDTGVLTFQEDGNAGVAKLELTDDGGVVHVFDTLSLSAQLAGLFGMNAGDSLLNAGPKQITGIKPKTVQARGATIMSAAMTWAPPAA